MSDYQDPRHWYWRLADDRGETLASREVALDPADPEYEAFLDLPHYLDVHADPYRRHASEVGIVSRLGEWMGRCFYGPVGEKILEAGTPAVVRVTVPPEAAGLLYRPWELGYVRGAPLALQDVTLVFEEPGEKARVNRAPVGERLRILAVFSMPVGAGALSLRQERYELARTLRAMPGAIDLRVLQYGVTRDSLAEILEEGEGWDMVHFSGHGLAAHLVLEKPDGTKDVVPSSELVKLLRPARGRLKWVTLSACLSAAAMVAETRLWLGLDPRRGTAAAGTETGELPAVARALVQGLDCAVLAMRYPVGDRFAIALGHGLLERVLQRGQPLARALQLTLPAVLGGPEVEASAVATPTLFGGYAAQVALAVPEGEAPVRLGMAGFREEPKQFVGRVDLLAKARAALARNSGSTGVLFHGMSGAGKTACALELAYQYEDAERFQRFLWWEAPKGDSDIAGTLGRLAQQWDIQVNAPELSLVAMVNNDDATFTAQLPRLSSFLGQRSVLIVLDNLESLLRENGKWHDPRWEKLLAALLNHHGRSRVVLTSRVRPRPAGRGVLELPVHSLTLDETVLLARQSKNLGALLRNPEHRELAIETLKLVQGHPKLLDLAEAQAASVEALTAHLKRAREAETAGAAELDAFFRDGASALAPEGFLGTLYGWTRSVAGTLSGEAHALFHRLCCMEEEDREQRVINSVWGAVTVPAGELMAAGLVDAEYRIHPGVAEAGREEAGLELRNSVDVEMAGFWVSRYREALKKETESMGGMVRRAARSAVPYLMRQQQWNDSQWLLEQVIYRDQSPATVAEALPLLARIVKQTEGTEVGRDSAAVYARALVAAGRTDEAKGRMQKLERESAELGQFWLASVVAGHLVNLMLTEGHFEQALATVERKKDYTRKAGLGRWTRLLDEVRRLQILAETGRYEEVLTTVGAQRVEIGNWPESSNEEEAVSPWNVLETLLDTGHTAAFGLKRWEEALSLNKEIAEVKTRRDAPRLELVRTRYNDYGPLLRLRRHEEARQLLDYCLSVFTSDGGSEEMGLVHTAIADLEANLGHLEEAIRHEGVALRYWYSSVSPENCAISHFNLANSLSLSKANARDVLAHRLASALISYQTNHGRLPNTLRTLGTDLAAATPADVPATFDEVCTLVEQTEGVHFRDLFARLPKRAASGDEALQAVLAGAAGK